MNSDKLKDWLRISVTDMLNDPNARRELTKMMLNYCLNNAGKKPVEELENDFINTLIYFVHK